MEILVALLFIVLLVVILSFKKSVNSHLEKINRDIWKLKEDLLKNNMPPAAGDVKPVAPVAIFTEPTAPTEKEYWESNFKPIVEPQKEEQLTEKEQLVNNPAAIIPVPVAEDKPKEEKTVYNLPPQSTYHPTPAAPGFFERHPDLEKFIGENLINKIGIAILVLAIGFFVKYAIDNNWIGPIGRVGIGILCGAILVALAHRLRKNYKGFSSVLAGGGLAIFYFTITLAYHQFHLFSQATSFIIMIVITAFAVALSILYDKQELAIIALAGGFATPLLVSNGSGNYQTLFTYLLVLNTGLLIIAYNKAWRLLNILSFAFTVILFGAWIMKLPENTIAQDYRNGLLFATAFYLLFFIINIANNIKENKRFIASDFAILLLNTSLYFAAGLYFINAMQAGNYRGFFSAAMGVFNLSASYILFRKQRADNNILYLLIGITLTFVSLTAPLQLHGNYITLFWASEAVLLYWLYQRSSIGIIRYSSFIIWIAMLVSLLMDWFNIYTRADLLPVIFNKGYITGLYAAAACCLLFFLIKKEKATANGKHSFFHNVYVAGIAGVIILYASGALEINYQYLYYYPGTAINVQYILLYTYVFTLLYAAITQYLTRLKAPWQTGAVLISLCLVLYLIFTRGSFVLLHHLLDVQQYSQQFAAHWLGALIAGILFLLLVKLIRKHLAGSANYGLITWLLCTWMVIFLSAETYLVSNRIYYKAGADWYRIGSIFQKTALPILWGLCSFVFMWLGMRHKYRTLRIVSLVLFSITLLKLFLFDIRNIPAAGKIAAFFCLGVLLLVVSFMYQRLKRIITEDEKKLDV